MPILLARYLAGPDGRDLRARAAAEIAMEPLPPEELKRMLGIAVSVHNGDRIEAAASRMPQRLDEAARSEGERLLSLATALDGIVQR